MTSLNDKQRSRIIIGSPSGKIAVHGNRSDDRIQDLSSGAASTINLVNRDVNEIENTTKSCVRRGYVRDEIRLVDVKKKSFFSSQSQRSQRVVVVVVVVVLVVLVAIIKIPPLATPTRACFRECEYPEQCEICVYVRLGNTFGREICQRTRRIRTGLSRRNIPTMATSSTRSTASICRTCLSTITTIGECQWLFNYLNSSRNLTVLRLKTLGLNWTKYDVFIFISISILYLYVEKKQICLEKL